MTYVITEQETYKPKREVRMAKALEFVFQFPPIQGVFDTGYGIVYMFGELHENEIEDIIVHESMHYVILKVAGKRASLKLDRIYNVLVSV